MTDAEIDQMNPVVRVICAAFLIAACAFGVGVGLTVHKVASAAVSTVVEARSPFVP